ncbi:portal protein [Methylophilales phage HIM624-A]|nr:portal protein [Methylophilales phage HIM624-A]
MADENRLKSILESDIDDAIGYLETETTDERQQALEYYNREPYGNEVEGKSQIVTGEVAEVVDGALPQLMRVFTSADDAVVFEPVNQGDEETAEQATEYVNHIFYKDNNGFEIMHDWMKDALLQKVGVVKAYWDDKQDVTKEKYYGLNDDELAMIMQDDEVEVVEQDSVLVQEAQFDPMTGMEISPALSAHDIKVKRTVDKGKVVVENVPPEEFLISKRARTIADAPFVAHRKMMTRGELIAMGYDEDTVMSLETGDALEFSPERIARYSRGEQPSDMDSDDEMMQLVEYFECYIQTDFDEDGIAEMRRVCYASNEILHNEECDYIPFHSICPIPIPHKFYGHSLADRAMDLQLIKSTITRQMLDNLYLTNNYRVGAVEGQVNLDDLLTSTAGGVVRMKNPNAIVPMTVQSNAGQSFPMLGYLDELQSKRTGVSDAQQGLNPDILQNVTATAVSAMQSASQGKLELISRIFADTGVSSLFKGILQLVCKYQQKERIIRVNNKYVPFDPREWSSEYNISVNVGLGTGSKQEQLATMQMILAKQEQLLTTYGLGNPLVNLKQYRDTLAKFVQMAGFKDDSAFLMEVTEEQAKQLAQMQAQAGTQNPQLQAAQQLAQVEREKAQLKAQTDQAKLQLDREQMELQAQQDALELKQKEVQQTTDLALKELKIRLDAEGKDGQLKTDQAKMIMDALEKIDKINRGAE